ncbi:MAG: cytochrome c [Myxococcota bacterium]
MSKRWHRTGAVVTALGLLSVSTMALGLPWDIDMADSQSKEAYDHRMPDLPEGVVSQKNLVSPSHFTPNVARGSEASQRLLAPVANAQRIEKGSEMYQIYCYPCHGDQGGAANGLGPVAWTEAAPARLKGIPYLAGPSGVVKDRDDQWLYVTIRNGGGNMPSYGHAMNDEEMWSIVHYLRTLPYSKQATADEGEQ